MENPSSPIPNYLSIISKTRDLLYILNDLVMANHLIEVKGKGDSHLDRLAPELIVNIVSHLPNLKSVLTFSSTAHKYRTIIIENQRTIVRNLAATILEDDDPEVIRLAFLACNATLIEYPDYRGVRKFIKKYVNPAEKGSDIYNFRALSLMRGLSVNVEILLDWTATYATLWPLKLSDKAYTATEITRMRRIIYLVETGFRLLYAIPEPGLRKLADRFWRSFPLWDVDRAYAYMRMISCTDWKCKYSDHKTY
ncbi:hypothetical protein F4805DRAFT_420332 [Annulohypoxylon moriforme]|nr:hypothetical protein F4805DRAFT_420332 [Annulohypoxylon moriforme]